MVQLVPSNMDISDFAGDVHAHILKADALTMPGYAGVLNDALSSY